MLVRKQVHLHYNIPSLTLNTQHQENNNMHFSKLLRAPNIGKSIFCMLRRLRTHCNNNNNTLFNEADIHYLFPSSFHYGPPTGIYN